MKELSKQARGRPDAAAVLAREINAESWIQLQQSDPDYARQVQALLDVAGHRGPGETELSNVVYADAPWLLLRAVAGVNDTAPHQPMEAELRDLVARLLTKASWSMIARRERCRDAVMRLTHQLRMALRERGSRMVVRGLLVESDDIFYLTTDEIFSSLPDLVGAVSRRRTERERLAKVHLPLGFIQPMNLSESSDAVGPQRTISGVPAVWGSL